MLGNKKKLVLECGFNALDRLADKEFTSTFFYKATEENLDSQMEAARDVAGKVGVDLDFIYYSGFMSQNSGARSSNLSDSAQIISEVRVVNGIGLDFMLVLNGGLSRPQEGLDDEEDAVLSLMHAINMKYGESNGIENKVTITNDKLLPEIRDKFPSIPVVASCLSTLDPRNGKNYGKLFEDYDYVVPLSQHTTYDFLKQFADYANKMIPFLKIGCAKMNLNTCLAHYVGIEIGEDKDFVDLDRYKQGDYVHDCQLPGRGCGDEKAYLIYRNNDLNGLIEMGVNKFKLERASSNPITKIEFRKLCRAFEKYGK